MSDTTNVVRAGHTPSERTVVRVLDEIFRTSTGRIILATFASNINRIGQIIKVAENHGRKVAVVGRSMEQNVRIAIALGYIEAEEGTLVTAGQVEQLPSSEVAVITTGSQGEPLSALARMATDEHKKIQIDPRRHCCFEQHAYPWQ